MGFFPIYFKVLTSSSTVSKKGLPPQPCLKKVLCLTLWRELVCWRI